MANKDLKSLTFPGLDDKYVIPEVEIDNTLSQEGVAADAKATGDELSDLKSALNDVYPTDTASGAIASFPDGADDIPVKALSVAIEPVQAGSGDPSPTNVRPISGWTQANIYREAEYDAEAEPAITIDLDGTVYGGTLDVNTGVLTVDRAMVDLGALTWNYVSGSAFNLRSTSDIGAASPATTSTVPNAVSSVYPVLSYVGVSGTDKSLAIVFATSGQAGMVWVHDTSYTDAATFKAAMSGVQLCYELATPLTVTLTTEQLTTLYGTNNIWSDAGNVDVTYRADVGLYIDKLTGSTEEDMIADAPIDSGQYFLVGNTLYLATAAIAAGATLTPGTNCVKTTLAEALNTLNS